MKVLQFPPPPQPRKRGRLGVVRWRCDEASGSSYRVWFGRFSLFICPASRFKYFSERYRYKRWWYVGKWKLNFSRSRSI